MDVKTQQLLIVILGIIGLANVLTGHQSSVDIIIAGLIGFLGQKTLTDKQSEILNQAIKSDGEEDVQ